MDKMRPLLEKVFASTSYHLRDLNLIGVTTLPGLLGPLLTGLHAAKTLSLLFKVPIVPVNHLFAHLEAIHLNQEVRYPYLGMLISGGHGLFFYVEDPETFHLIGGTVDDAPGEALDKAGKMLNLGYPAGRLIDELAKSGNKHEIDFPIGLKHEQNADLSYSGTKTALRTYLEGRPEWKDKLEDICASYQFSIMDALRIKLQRALEICTNRFSESPKQIVVGGGVAANSFLREHLPKFFNEVVFVPPFLCTDNGAMIANYAYRTREKAVHFPFSLQVDAHGQFLSKHQLMNDRKKKQS